MAVSRSVALVVVATAVATGSLAPAPAAAAAAAGPRHVLCVGARHGCLRSLRKALRAAADGDTIRLGPGRFRGGVTIAKSLHVVGAGSRRTSIAGGGPVVTVALRAHGSRPTVTLSDLALTGGTATGDGVRGFGGGLYVLPAPGGKAGATVTLRRVWVHGNRASATRTSSSPSGVKCPHGDCPFALGAGGGIFNSGRLTLVDSRVDHNAVNGRLSDADGGGIYSQDGSLTLRSSVVAHNQVQPKGIGRFAEGGGVFVDSGRLTVTRTTVEDNAARLRTSYPVTGQGVVISMSANSGGIHIGDGVHASISRSQVVGNEVSAVDPHGEPAAFDSAMLVGDSTVTVDRTGFDHNVGYADSATDADAGLSGTTVEFDGPARVTRSRIADNRATSVSSSGPAGVSSGLGVFDFSGHPRTVTVSDTVITGNRAYVHSATGAATGTGGGVLNNSLLVLRDVTVTGNAVQASGPAATAQGGGVWNGALLSGPPVTLRVAHSRITGNAVMTSKGGKSRGGGVYAALPFTRVATTIRHNTPGNVYRVVTGR